MDLQELGCGGLEFIDLAQGLSMIDQLVKKIILDNAHSVHCKS
jgi:hypothetical protein